MLSRSRATLRRQLSQSRSRLSREERPRLALEDGTIPTPADRLPKTARDLVVVQTYVVAGPTGTGISHYQILLAPDATPDAPLLVLLTRQEAIYRRALKAEGDPLARVDVWYHPSKRPDGTYCRLVDALEDRIEP